MEMEKDTMSDTGKKLGFGFMRLPLKDDQVQTSVDFTQLCGMVDVFLERGFTYFDTAYMYHEFQSEIFLREALVKRHARESFTVADKLPTMFIRSKEDAAGIFNEQLEKCGVGYFDYYMLHNLGVSHYEIAKKFDCFPYLSRMKAEGKVREIGFSFHDTADLLDEILTEHPEVDFVQLQLNYLDWDNPGIQSGKCYETVVKHGKKVIVMEPVKGGTLASVPEKAERIFKEIHPELSVPSWAIRFAADQEHVMMVLSGMSSMEQLMDNTSYMQEFRPLTETERDAIAGAVSSIREAIAVPCTACQYCVDGCPRNIPIPKYFALLNAEKQALNKSFSTQKVYYGNYSKNYGRASECIACRKCEGSCPQHLPVVSYLRQVAEEFEN